jgi:hypothetical protein
MRRYFRMAAAGAIALAAMSGVALCADKPKPPAAEQADPVESPRDTWTMVLDDHHVQPVLGKDVRSPSGEDMGRIVDIIVDGSGRPRAAVIDFGGFLGVGSRKIVLDWRALHFAPAAQAEQITVDLTRDQVKAAPEYKSGKPVVVVGAIGAAAAPEM